MMPAKPSKPIRFITIEGGEGAGKSSLMEVLVKAYSAKGETVIKTREPGGTELGNGIRQWLLSHSNLKIDSKAELLLFLAARAQHIDEVIQPALDSGKIVLCDRFNDSTIAYQGMGRGLGVDYVRALCLQVCGKTLPDLTFYLDVDPVVGLQRTKALSKENAGAGQVDRIESEKLAFHQQVRQAFIQFAKEEPGRFAVLDANQPQNKVIAQALSVLKL